MNTNDLTNESPPSNTPAASDSAPDERALQHGRSGEGADSLLTHLREQEERDKPLRGR